MPGLFGCRLRPTMCHHCVPVRGVSLGMNEGCSVLTCAPHISEFRSIHPFIQERQMIVFEIGCSAGHRFEGWFASAEDFQKQRAARQVSCPVCGSHLVDRIPTAKIVRPRGASLPVSEDAERHPPAPPEQKREMTLAAFIDHVMMNSEDVGARFAEEARKIHEEQAAKRSIRGTATPEDTQALIEEGIPVLALPVPPKDSWH